METSRPQYELVERGEELAFGNGEHVQRVDDAVGFQILEQCPLQQGLVVAVVERAGAREEIQIRPSTGVVEPAAPRPIEQRWPLSASSS